MKITANDMHFQVLNDAVRHTTDKEVVIDQCIGQRYIGSGLSDKTITINGTPGNALGAYLDGATITVNGNAQDATGDTMNEGAIFIHGSSGDATGYAMRGGKIFVEGNVGYRAGIHMKAYQTKLPVLIVGGQAGSFLGEYQAGGLIVVLNLYDHSKTLHSNFCATGMHGGELWLHCDECPTGLPSQVIVEKATDEQLQKILPHLEEFCAEFGKDIKEVSGGNFWRLVPNAKNPYKRLYTNN